MRPGKRNLITDVAGLLVGQSEDHTIKTGVSVITSGKPFTAALHIMGGAPGTRDTDLLAPDKLVQQVDAIVLSGGSVFGLDAASGVADALRNEGRGFQFGDMRVPVTPGAVLFDLLNGGDKKWDDNPYPALGKIAYKARSNEFDIGTAGAATGGRAGTLKGGTGSASLVLENGSIVGALVALNSVGNVVGDDWGRFFAAPFEFGCEFGGRSSPDFRDAAVEPVLPGNPNGNTAIAVVATDVIMDQAQLTRMATAAHDGLARAILPSHTPFDGDLVFAVSTGRRDMTDPLEPMRLGHAAAVSLSRSVARAVFHATKSDDDVVSTWSDKFG